MKKWMSYVGVLVVSLVLTSCFEIKQKVDVNKDGSGYYTFSFDMGEMGKMLEQKAAESGEEFDFGSDADVDFEDEMARLEGVEGISEVTTWQGDEGVVFNIGFQFEDFDALNRGANLILNEADDEEAKSRVLFSSSRDSYKFHGFSELMNKVNEAMKEESDSTAQMMAMFFQDVVFTTEMNFEDEVDRVDNERVLLKGDKKGIVFQFHPFRESEIEMPTGFEVELD